MKYLKYVLFFIPSIFYAQNIIQYAELNDLDNIKVAVFNGADVNYQNQYGFTALHIAAWNNSEDIMIFLLENGANPNIISKEGSSPLRFAAPKTKALLIRYGATNTKSRSPRTQEENINQKIPKNSYQQLHNLSYGESLFLHNWDAEGNNSLHRAAKIGDLPLTKSLIKQGINPLLKNNHGSTALHIAAESDHLDIVKYLIEDITMDINSANNEGNTPLLASISNNNVEMTKYLITLGANINQTSDIYVFKDDPILTKPHFVSNWTPLMTSALVGNTNILKLMLNANATINAVDSENWSPLMTAAQKGNLDAVVFLLKSGANYQIKSTKHRTVVEIAHDFKHPKITSAIKDFLIIKQNYSKK